MAVSHNAWPQHSYFIDEKTEAQIGEGLEVTQLMGGWTRAWISVLIPAWYSPSYRQPLDMATLMCRT
jgi:hypothetical protein